MVRLDDLCYIVSTLNSFVENSAAYRGGIPLHSINGIEKCPRGSHFGASVLLNAVNRGGVLVVDVVRGDTP